MLLTPSDKAFILLLVIVYFKEHANSGFTKLYERTTFVLRSGWQEAGVHFLISCTLKYRKIVLKL